VAFTLNSGTSPRKAGVVVFSCDYNGWADVPEEEREAIDAFEVADRLPAALPGALVFFDAALLASRPVLPPSIRKAA
jgi:hypothetical protein